MPIAEADPNKKDSNGVPVSPAEQRREFVDSRKADKKKKQAVIASMSVLAVVLLCAAFAVFMVLRRKRQQDRENALLNGPAHYAQNPAYGQGLLEQKSGRRGASGGNSSSRKGYSAVPGGDSGYGGYAAKQRPPEYIHSAMYAETQPIDMFSLVCARVNAAAAAVCDEMRLLSSPTLAQAFHCNRTVKRHGELHDSINGCVRFTVFARPGTWY